MSITFLTLFTTIRCNNSCQHCLYGCNPNTGDDMSWNIFNKAIKIALDHKINTINLFGGEPFLNKNIFNMIEHCLLNNLQIILATNGKILSKDNVYDQFIRITEEHKDMIRITIGNDEYHLPFFNPESIGKKLKNDGYIIVMPEYTDNTLIITDNNKKQDRYK